jgi:hypothetical protein
VTASPPSSRRFAPTALIVIGVVLLVGVSFATWWLASPPTSSSGGGVWWRLVGGPESVVADYEGDAPRLDQATIQSATEIPVVTYYPWPDGRQALDDSWLGTPTIVYRSSAVIITMHMSGTVCSTPAARSECGWSLEPRYVKVPIHLREPLGGRGLFDGSTNPPTQRWFAWSPASMIDLPAVKASYTEACKLLLAIDAVTCRQIDIEGMTAEERMLAVPTILGPADKDRAYAFCRQIALAHVDADPKVKAYEQGIRVIGKDGVGLTACSIHE